MKISIYQDPRGNAVGGGEYCIVILANHLLKLGHQVDLYHHQGPNYLQRLADCFEIDISDSNDKPLEQASLWCVPHVKPWARLNAMRKWQSIASQGYDRFVCSTHNPPPFCHANVGLVYVHFPFQVEQIHCSAGSLKLRLVQLFQRQLWARRLKSYSLIIANSIFTQHWVARYWQSAAKVIYPPVDIRRFFVEGKQRRIIVLGRFTENKKQRELIKVFNDHRAQLVDWTLVCIGSLDDANKDYFHSLVELAEENVELIPNASRETIARELARASFFWHAMGIDVDEQLHPVRVEHFGIATVEAMAAGCVPIVPDRGGQREIVSQAGSGCVCNSLQDYPAHTLAVLNEVGKFEELSKSAQARAQDFSRQLFEREMVESLQIVNG